MTELKMLVQSVSNAPQAESQMLVAPACSFSAPVANAGLTPAQLFPMPCMLPGVFAKIPVNFGFWAHRMVHRGWVLVRTYFWAAGCTFFSFMYSQSQQRTRKVWDLFSKDMNSNHEGSILMTMWPSKTLLPNAVTLVVGTWPIIWYQTKTDTHQLNRIESTEIDPHRHGQSISHKVIKAALWGKDNLFMKWH